MGETCRFALVGLVAVALPAATLADTFQERVDALPAAVTNGFQPDPCSGTITALDDSDFQQINLLDGPKLLTNATGWEVIARTGGRPFSCFHSITVNSAPIPFDPTAFMLGGSNINQATLDAHFAAGKQVNRLWFTHPASNGFPIVVVFTPDGFFNLGGAQAPLLQGSAARVGFIGEPFTAQDFAGHADELEINTISDDVVEILYSFHSEAGEAVIHSELRWNKQLERPEVTFRSTHLAAASQQLGFAGLNFLRGPTTFGLSNLAGCSLAQVGIESFHDARSALLFRSNGVVERIPLTPPHGSGGIVDSGVLTTLSAADTLVVDQPQSLGGYFSKTPGVPYDQRADFSLELMSATQGAAVKKAQVSVNLNLENPEANETANVFFASDFQTDSLATFEYKLVPHRQPFEKRGCGLPAGLFFVSNLGQAPTKLAFLTLDDSFDPAGMPRAVSDEVIRSPRRPDVARDGVHVALDAEDYGKNDRHRVFVFDRREDSYRRVTVDPFASGATEDSSPSLSPDGSQFLFTTDRKNVGNFLLSADLDTDVGLSCGFGSTTLNATDVDWSPSRNEAAITGQGSLRRVELATTVPTTIDLQTNARNPDFSPSGDQVAFASDAGIHVAARDGSSTQLIRADGDHPTWLTEDLLVIQRMESGETDLFRISISDANELTRLTPSDGVDAIEPSFARRPCGLGSRLFQAAELGVFADAVWFLDRDGDSSFAQASEVLGWGLPGNTPVRGDWSGNGSFDPGVFSSGFWFIDRNSDRSFDFATEAKPWGLAGWTPMPGDWNGDGITDLGVVNSDSVWFRDLNGDFIFDPATEAVGWGGPGNLPLVADWNGDGRDKIGVYADGAWFIDLDGNGSFNPSTESKTWGVAGWTPMPGDWNGDGAAELGAVAPNGNWLRDLNGDFVFDSSTEVIGWGSPGDTPVVGDWNGDGTDKIGAYSGGAWLLDVNGDGAFDPGAEFKGWGFPGAQPLPGPWN